MFIVYIKYEGNNISTMTTTLIFVISCEVFGLVEPFIVSWWGHVMPKCCQYAIDDTKISSDLMSIFIKSVNLFCKK